MNAAPVAPPLKARTLVVQSMEVVAAAAEVRCKRFGSATARFQVNANAEVKAVASAAREGQFSAGRPSFGGRRTAACGSEDRMLGCRAPTSRFGEKKTHRSKRPLSALNWKACRGMQSRLRLPPEILASRVACAMVLSLEALLQFAEVRPNPSLERTRNGKAPWPRNAFVYDALRGQGALPLRAAQLKR